jgi:hypothetical protein
MSKIVWLNEATFKLNGRINQHNCVHWASESAHINVNKAVNIPGLGCHTGVQFY